MKEQKGYNAFPMVPRLDQMSAEEIVAFIDGYRPDREHRERLYEVLSGVNSNNQNQAIIDAYHEAKITLLRRSEDSSRAAALKRQEEHRQICDGLLSEMSTVLNGALIPQLREKLTALAPDLVQSVDALSETLRAAAMGEAPR